MTTASDKLWMPSAGPHPVSVGSSLSKALKARRGTAAPAKRSHLPDREFYSFRYNFKPGAIDPTKPGTIDVRKGADTTSVTVEHASTQPGEGQLFQGTENPAKEWECVLIYDEELGTFTLEKLDSYVVLNYDKKTTVQSSSRPSDSPRPRPSGSTPPLKTAARNLDFVEQLERDLLGMEDAEGEPDDEFEEIMPKKPSQEAMKQEEEEGSEPETALAKAKAELGSSRSTNPKPSVKAASRTKPSAAGTSATPAVQKQSKVTEKAKEKGVKRSRDPIVNADEEDLEFGKPTRPAKAPRTSTPASQGLALPTAQAAGQMSLALPLGGGPSQPPQTTAPPPADASDSEDEWDEVPADPPPHTGATVTLASDEPVRTVPANESDEEEIDEHAFEKELNEQLGQGDEDDFLARAVSPEPEPSMAGSSVPIMSLNRYAGGDVFGDDDYSSSSDESDD